MTPIMVKFKKSRKKVTFFLHLNIECPQYRRRSERKRAEMAALGVERHLLFSQPEADPIIFFGFSLRLISRQEFR